jgi:hypothetical protein
MRVRRVTKRLEGRALFARAGTGLISMGDSSNQQRIDIGAKKSSQLTCQEYLLILKLGEACHQGVIMLSRCSKEAIVSGALLSFFSRAFNEIEVG